MKLDKMKVFYRISNTVYFLQLHRVGNKRGIMELIMSDFKEKMRLIVRIAAISVQFEKLVSPVCDET